MPEPSAQAPEPSAQAAEPSAQAADSPAAAAEWYELAPIPTPAEATEPAVRLLPAGPLTPPEAFDALYTSCAPTLVRQTYLLTGRHALARESVQHAFQLAWQHWPEVAVDPDPRGWVRAAAHEYALSPWHRLRPHPRFRRAGARRPPQRSAAPDREGTTVTDRALIAVLLQLPPPYRRALLLYDGVGLDLPDTAAETEASTAATAGRLMYAREAVGAYLPELADPEVLHRCLTEAVKAEGHWVIRSATPSAVRVRSERLARCWTYAAASFTVLLLGTTVLTLRTAPDHYEPPVAPGSPVQGVPPKPAMGPLSPQQLELLAKLRAGLALGSERLVPEIR